MSTVLPPEIESYVRQRVESGEFDSREAVISEAISLYREMETRREKLRGDIRHAVEQVERGDVVEFRPHSSSLRTLRRVAMHGSLRSAMFHARSGVLRFAQKG